LERGFPTHREPASDKRDALLLANNTATKPLAEMNKNWTGKTLDERVIGTSGDRAREMHEQEGGWGR